MNYSRESRVYISYPRESVNAGCLVLPSQPSLVSFSICTDVFLVAKRQIEDCLLDYFITALFPHALSTADIIHNVRATLVIREMRRKSQFNTCLKIILSLLPSSWLNNLIPVIGMASCTIPVTLCKKITTYRKKVM